MIKYLPQTSFCSDYQFSAGTYAIADGAGLVITGKDFILDGNGAELVSSFTPKERLPVTHPVFSAGSLCIPGTHSLMSKQLVTESSRIYSVSFAYNGPAEAIRLYAKTPSKREYEAQIDMIHKDSIIPDWEGTLSLGDYQGPFRLYLEVTSDVDSRYIVDSIKVIQQGGEPLWEADPREHLGDCYNIGFSIYDPGTYREYRGTAITLSGCTNVTVRNFSAKGFRTGILLDRCQGCRIEYNDLSDNYTDPEYGWGDGKWSDGAIILQHSHRNTIVGNTALKVWNGLVLMDSNKNHVSHNTISHCANVCLKLSRACENSIVENDFSWGLRIYPGEVHARDSVSCLIENGSDGNTITDNDFSHGGDGIFIRVLNHWCSMNNRFIRNNCSFANNNAIEAWSPRNSYVENLANNSSYGFWLGGSDETIVSGNTVNHNGQEYHNAPEHFGNSGIAIVNGSAEGVVLTDNMFDGNYGPALALGSSEPDKTAHWLIANNHITSTKNDDRGYEGHGMYLYHCEDITIVGNTFRNISGDELSVGAENRSIRCSSRSVDQRPLVISGSTYVKQEELLSLTVDSSEEKAIWVVGENSYEGGFLTLSFKEPKYQRIFCRAGDRIAWHSIYVLPAGEKILAEGPCEFSTCGVAEETPFTVFGEDVELSIELNWPARSFKDHCLGMFIQYNHESELELNRRRIIYTFLSPDGEAVVDSYYPGSEGYQASVQRYTFRYKQFFGSDCSDEIAMTTGFDIDHVMGMRITASGTHPGMGELIVDNLVSIPNGENV